MISIVVPTYKEAENIPELCRRVDAAMKSAALDYEMIIVDDDSSDGSEAAVQAAADSGVAVRIIIRHGRRGLASAVVEGFDAAAGEYLLCMDADLSHPPEALGDMAAAIAADDCDFVIGSRYVSGGGTDDDWGFLRWVNSKVATLMARPFTSARDPMAGFFSLSAKTYAAAREAGINSIGYKIGLELLVKGSCKQVREVPIQFAQRHAGESKLSLREQINYLKHLKTLADFRFGWFSRLMQFCAVGASGAIVDLGCYALLLGVAANDHLSRAIAIWLAMSWNFIANRKVTFHDARQHGIMRQYFSFVAASLLGAVINWTVSVHLGPKIPILTGHPMFSAIAGILCGTVSNFWFSTKVVFPRHEKR